MGLMLATYTVRSGSSALGNVAASAACAAASPGTPPARQARQGGALNRKG